jgi:hypothetical protein
MRIPSQTSRLHVYQQAVKTDSLGSARRSSRKLRPAPYRVGPSSGCRRLRCAANLTDEIRIWNVDVMGGEELHLWLSGYARFLYS